MVKIVSRTLLCSLIAIFFLTSYSTAAVKKEESTWIMGFHYLVPESLKFSGKYLYASDIYNDGRSAPKIHQRRFYQDGETSRVVYDFNDKAFGWCYKGRVKDNAFTYKMWLVMKSHMKNIPASSWRL
ncbi:hypothetical protein [Anaerovibrio sp. RM50]|uniref:hypothetical protein n=1 Tax=Anaerovibrio sp. RM50 TaxID=1200557 RepID=UPI000481AD4C|nr:hypothetical protein [Anaerovibrio sp. RM50]